MDRRKFLSFLGTGALAAMLAPSIAKAFEAKELSEDDLWKLVSEGSPDGKPVLISQEGVVVARCSGPTKHAKARPPRLKRQPWGETATENYDRALDGRGHVRIKNGETVTMKYALCGSVGRGIPKDDFRNLRHQQIQII